MIIFNISGGLGNQFFQYAFGRSLAMKNQTDLYCTFNSYKSDEARQPKLDYFKTEFQIADTEQINSYLSVYQKLHPYIKKLYRQDSFVALKTYFDDRHEFGFQAKLLKARKGYFNGYWGREEYFKEIRPTLLKELELRDESNSQELIKLKNEARIYNAVAVHIRRGDYVSNDTFASIFNQLPLTYYLSAIDSILERVENPFFYIFSDDPSWVKTNLLHHLSIEYCVIEDQLNQIDYLEFSLMKSCHHFIIANSTFSWWAAWLSEYEDKIVIAPKEWYADKAWQKQYEQNSFLPDTWARI